MRTIFRITITELQTLFCSPIAWFVLIVFIFQANVSFVSSYNAVLKDIAIGNNSIWGVSSQLVSILNGLIGQMFLYIPLLTMGLISREVNSGSIKLLYSCPISNYQIVIGKFLAMIVMALLFVSILFAFAIFSDLTVLNFELAHFMTGILAVFLVICVYSSIGLFLSSLTSYPVVAAIGTFAVLAFMNYTSNIASLVPFIGDFTYWLSLSGRTTMLLRGFISSGDVLYFVFITLTFVVFTIIRLDNSRRKTSSFFAYFKYVFVFGVLVLLANISLIPSLIVNCDTTSNKENLVSENGRKLIDRFDGDVKVTTYSNILDNTYSTCDITSERYDQEIFQKFPRTLPEFEVKNVFYYHASGEQATILHSYGDVQPFDIVKSITESYNQNPNLFKSLEEIDNQDALEKFRYKFVRVFEHGGKKVFLQTYDDGGRHPHEMQILSKLRLLLDEPAHMATSDDFAQRSVIDRSSKGHSNWVEENNRRSYSTYGIENEIINLENPIDTTLDFIILSDMKEKMSDKALANYKNYIEQGGNAVILGDYNRQEFMNPLIDIFGLQFTDEMIIS